MVKIGVVVFANNSGLGNQSRRLVELIRPSRILAIDSSGFSQNKDQHFDWYSGFSGYKVSGFPNNFEVRKFVQGLTHVLVCENPMNFYLLDACKRLGIKLYIASNYEFCDHLNKELTLPYKFLMPSYWHLDTMKSRFGDNIVEYLPPPIDPAEFATAREINIKRTNTPRFLHIAGTIAVNDRNGTLTLLQSLKTARSNFELVIRSQRELPRDYIVDDKRVRYIMEDERVVSKMYEDYDALILPRRYGGLSLTTNEALMSAMPVIMTDISPNNQLLPEQWLVKAKKTGEFTTRTAIDIYTASSLSLSKKIDSLTREVLDTMKLDAFEIGYNNFSHSVLRNKYQALWLQ